MGTQTVFPIQTLLTRRTPKGDEYDEVVVVGGGDKVAIQPRSFGETIELTGGQINSEYDVQFPEGAVLSTPTYLDPGPSPEQQFAEMAREAGLEYNPTLEPPRVPTPAELAKLEESERVMAERAAEELSRTNTVVTEVQEQPQVGQASHEAEPVVKPPETEGDKTDTVTVTSKPSPARGKKTTNASAKKTS